MAATVRRAFAAVVVLVCALCVGAAAPVAPAGAAVTVYAAVDGSGTTCTATAPCALADALAKVGTGDEVVAYPGTYALPRAAVRVPSGATLRGASVGAGRSVLQVFDGVWVQDGARLLDIEVQGVGAGIDVFPGASADRIVSRTSGSATACSVRGGVLTNSLCVATGPGVGANISGAAGVISGTTIVGGTIGTHVNGGTITNTISRGGTREDIWSVPTDPFPATMASSYFESVWGNTPAGPGNVRSGLAVQDTTSYRPTAASTTIDRGSATAPAGGGRDADAGLRSRGAARDIGAHELATRPSISNLLRSDGTRQLALQADVTTASDAVVSFQYGTTSGSYPLSVTQSAAAGTRTVVAQVFGLEPGTTYYYRVLATSDHGSTVTTEQTFTTFHETTTTVATNTPTRPGEPVVFTGTVVDDDGAPVTSGQVLFQLTGSSPVAGDLTADGTATASLPGTLAVGTYTARGVFESSGTYAGSASANPGPTHTVAKGTTATVLTSSSDPAKPGDTVTLTATVTGDRGDAATGSVTFREVGVATPTTVTLDAQGRATLSVTSAAAATRTFTAEYGGSSALAGSTSTALAQDWVQSGSDLTLRTSRNPVPAGSSLTISTFIDDPAGQPVTTGTLSLYVDDVLVAGPSTPDRSGRLTFTTSSLSIGTHTVRADYSGTVAYAADTASLQQEVRGIATATAVTSSANPVAAGDGVTFSAAITSGGAPVTSGSVTFTDGATTLASGVPVDTTGHATLTTSSLAVGEHTVVATYSGTTTLASSTGQVVQTVGARPTTVTVVAAPTPAAYGTSVTFTGTVTDSATGALVTTGTADIAVDGTVVASDVPVTGAGTVSHTTSALPVGTHTVTVHHDGVATRTPADGSTTHTTTQATTTTALASSANPSVVGGAVTLTATVASPLGDAGGTVTFTDGATTLGTGIVGAGGVATLATSTLAVGDHAIVATYSGDTSHTGSASSPLTQVVGRSTTTTALTTSGTPSYLGGAVTFTATITPAQAGPATGSVRFTDGATVLGTAPLVGGVAVLTTSDLALGNHLVAAEYLGSGTHSASSDNLTQVVTREPTTTTVTTSDATTTVGQSVTFTAVVAGRGRTPRGSVTFLDGTTVLGTVALDGSGAASWTTSTLTAGSHTIGASYAQSGPFDGSSGTVGQAVGTGATATALTSSASPSTYGASITFTATITGPGPVPTGTVTFTDGATVLAAGVPLVGGVATVTTAALAGGPHTVTAAYSGSSQHDPSQDDLVQQVDPGATTTTTSTSGSASTFGEAVTVTATVTGPGSTPSGTVTFTDGAATLGTAALVDGTASLTTDDLGGGAHTITASYGGSADHAPSQGAVAQQVDALVTTASLAVAPVPVGVGEDATFTATIAATAGDPTGDVTFRVDGADVLTLALDAAGQATMTYATTAAGAHAVTVAFAGSADHGPSTATAEMFVQQAVAGGPYAIAEGEDLVLDASGSAIRSSAVVDWDVDGDGAFDDATGATPTVPSASLVALGLGDGPLGPLDLAVRVTDGDAVAEDVTTLTVADSPPTATITGPEGPVTAGEPMAVVVAAEDPSAADVAAGIGQRVDWGDGSDPTIVEQADPAAARARAATEGVEVAHTFASAGTYEIAATAVGADGVEGPPATLTVTVVAAPVPPTPPPAGPTPPPSGPGTSPSGGPAPSGPLARTGSELAVATGFGTAAIAAGAATLLLARRRRRSPILR